MDNRHFEFGGLVLASAINLPLLDELPVNGCAVVSDIDILLSPDPLPESRLHHQSVGRYRLSQHIAPTGWIFRHENIGIMVEESGRLLTCHCQARTDLPLLAEILVRRILPKITYFHGRLPVHAATLGTAAGAVLLLGTSKTGKSTTTAALAQYLGWQIFSDDMSILHDTEDGATALNGACNISLWQDSVDGLRIPANQLLPMPGYDGKFSYHAGRRKDKSGPLKAIVLLADDNGGRDVLIEKIGGPEVLVMICSQIVAFDPNDVAENADHMARLKKLVEHIPVYILSYPRSFARLNEAVAKIGALVEMREHAAI